jgi:hypothetical protein
MVGLVVFSLVSGALSVVFLPPFSAGLSAAPISSAAPAVPLGERPTALEVAMSPFRYVGTRVRWTCLVDQVPVPTFADARCGLSLPEFGAGPLTTEELLHQALSQLRHRATVVLTGEVKDLEHDERIGFDGTVRPPLLGENAFGAERYYPTVHIDRFLAKQIAVY